MRQLSKSKLLSYRQCPKRLWLEVRHPELREEAPPNQVALDAGHQVGELARKLYDPQGVGHLIDPDREGWNAAFERTRNLVKDRQLIFEASFAVPGALAMADILQPRREESGRGWRLVEVKSSTGVKDYHLEDVAIQSFIVQSAGVKLTSVALAHVNSSWIYQGDGRYDGILSEVDVTQEATNRASDVCRWLNEAQGIAQSESSPDIDLGEQCDSPFPCPFKTHCSHGAEQVAYPISWLPRISSKKLKEYINDHQVKSMADVPDELLSPAQRNVKFCAVANVASWNEATARQLLGEAKSLEPPVWFLDFETIQFAVPIWAGTRPYQQIPFQYSVHRISEDGALTHNDFLDLNGTDPSHDLAGSLVRVCHGEGPVLAYNAGFERARILELANRVPHLSDELRALAARVVDLRPVAEKSFYSPRQQGSWSLKKVLPALFPNQSEMDYANLDGVQDGDDAVQAYLRAIEPGTSETERQRIEKALQAYCCLDTLSLVRIWEIFSGRKSWPAKHEEADQ